VDPAAEPLFPARRQLFVQHALTRTLAAPRLFAGAQAEVLPPDVVAKILDAADVAPLPERRARLRNRLLRQQLVPRGHFGLTQSQVFATGNGCYSMIGWLDKLLADDSEPEEDFSDDASVFGLAKNIVEGLNLPPRAFGRGLSETQSLESAELDEQTAAWRARVCLQGYDIVPASP